MFFNKLNKKGNLAGIDVNSINEAKQKAKENLDKKSEQFDDIYKEALLLLKKVLDNPNDKKSLKQSIIRFTQAIELKKTNPEPYFYLSYISYLCKDFELAKKYLEIASLINPNLNGLDSLRQKLLKV